MKSTNRRSVQLEAAKSAKEVLEAVRASTAGVPKPDDIYLRNLKGDVFSRPERPRDLSVGAMVALLYDALQKGAPPEKLEEVPDALRNAIRSWAKLENVPDFDTAHLAEEISEAAVDVAEAEFRLQKSGPALRKLENAHRRHTVTSEMQVRAARSMVFSGDVA